MKTIKIAITDDHKLFRDGLRIIINQFLGMEVVLEAENGEILLNKLAASEKLPDIVLMDLKMPVMNGIVATQRIKRFYPTVKVVILSMHDEDLYIYHLIQKGALGYLLKNAEPDEVEKTIRAVDEYGHYFSENVVRIMHKNIVETRTPSRNITYEGQSLTNREIEVLRMICMEKSNKEIADELSISERTVEGYRKTLMTKTGSRNSIGLAIYAVRNGVINI